MPLKGYRTQMPSGESYGYIQFRNFALWLEKTNQRAARCVECENGIEAGSGVYRRLPYQNGYLCLRCARAKILAYFKGFKENIIYNLQACEQDTGKWSADQVMEGMRKQ
jgi:hypothetical protein